MSPADLIGERPVFATELGVLFRGDCTELLPRFPDGCVDTVFADPPFNLGKEYGSSVNDRRADAEYLDWCRRWLGECCRVLKPGGAIFVYNIPRWNIELGHHLSTLGMQFRHWIAVSMKFGLPIPGRLYPAITACSTTPRASRRHSARIRTPIETCRHCGGEVKDYGGHRDAMNERA